jgi:hypothetical protein
VYLYGVGLTKFDLRLSDTQSGVIVYDVTGGSNITVSDKNQSIVNLGQLPTKVVAVAADAQVAVDGGTGGAELEIIDAGRFMLSNHLKNVTVELEKPSFVATGRGSIVLDAEVGDTRLRVEGSGQTILTGRHNVILDNSGGNITIEGTIEEFHGNVIAGFGKGDRVILEDLVPGELRVNWINAGEWSHMVLSAGGLTARAAFLGEFDSSRIMISNFGEHDTVLRFL